MRKYLLARINWIIRTEMKDIIKHCTILVKNASFATSYANSHSHYITLKRVAPVLIGMLDACIPKNSPKRLSITLACIAILVKSHGRNTIIHFIVSLILYSGHAGKMVNATIC